MTLRHLDKDSKSSNPMLGVSSSWINDTLTEGSFRRMMAVERKRTERSGEPFLLALLETDHHQHAHNILDNILLVLPSSIRETDVVGWYKDQTTIGVMFTGLSCSDKSSILSVILNKVTTMLRDRLTPDQVNRVNVSFHFFPDDWDNDQSERPSNSALYPDLLNPDKDMGFRLGIKRVMDIVGSALILILCAPLFLMIALVIKVTSKGPVLFRQQRVGQFGRCFTFLKFRSMHADNDHSVHKEYVTKLIAGEVEHRASNDSSDGMYKLTDDKRVTRVGKILRRTSLDELPQLVNVLRGEMSLVGPRPAIPYELAAYRIWHRRRVLAVKPGITGLWQISGRSRVKFDDMVRLDLRYATSWSPWLDLTILMRTPLAVIGGAGAC